MMALIEVDTDVIIGFALQRHAVTYAELLKGCAHVQSAWLRR